MKKILLMLVILSLITLILVGLAVVLKGLPGRKTEVDSRPQKVTESQKAGRILITTEVIPATTAGAPANVKLAIKPQSEKVTLSAFDLRLIVKTSQGNLKSGGAMTINKDLVSSDWSFPIKRVKTEEGQLIVEISGLHMAPQIFNLEGEQTLATIPLTIPTGEKITMELDNKITQFLDNQSLKLITAHEQK